MITPPLNISAKPIFRRSPVLPFSSDIKNSCTRERTTNLLDVNFLFYLVQRDSALSFRQGLNLNFTFQVEDASAFQFDAIIGQPTNDLSTSPRYLCSAKGSLAQSFGPIRRQHTISCAGYGIFRNTLGGGEIAADEVVNSVARGGHDHAAAVHAGERSHIRSEPAQELRIRQQSHVVELVGKSFDWNGP